MAADWKQAHAEASAAADEHPIVQQVIDNLVENLTNNFGPVAGNQLVRASIQKVAHVGAQVARAQCLGFDPDLLRLTPDEANSALMRQAAEMVFRGVPTQIVDE